MPDNTWKLERVIAGLRHKKTFQVLDKLGDMMDKIIPLQGTGSFPQDCFAKYGRTENSGVVLKDANDTQYLTMDVNGIVLDCDMTATPPLEVNNIKEMFAQIIDTAGTVTEGKSKIDRLGVIHHFSLRTDKNSAKEIFSNLVNVDLKGTPDEILLRFALKNPLSQSVYNPDNKVDYSNVFIEISSKKEEKEAGEERKLPDIIMVSVDYQNYFHPVRTTSSIDIGAHFEKASKYSEEIISSKIKFESNHIKHG